MMRNRNGSVVFIPTYNVSRIKLLISIQLFFSFALSVLFSKSFNPHRLNKEQV